MVEGFGRHIPIAGQVAFSEDRSIYVVSAILRREDKRGRLPFLPREILAGDEVQRAVDDRVRAGILGLAILFVFHVIEPPEGQVIIRVETGEPVGFPVDVRRPQVAPNEPVLVEVVDREFIDVDPPGKQDANGRARQRPRPTCPRAPSCEIPVGARPVLGEQPS